VFLRPALARTLVFVVVAGVAVFVAGDAGRRFAPRAGPPAPERAPLDEEYEEEGFDPQAASRRPTLEAAFARTSYAPGSRARLVVYGRAAGASLQLFRVGAEDVATHGNGEMQGVPVTTAVSTGRLRPARSLPVTVGRWASGLYFARIEAPGGRVGFAPFVVRPRRPGTSHVAVVLPTYTWQAYNFRDDDADGRPDTWYASWRTRLVRLNRPFLNRGVPPHFRRYDLPLLRWLAATGRTVDVLSDGDLGAARSGRALARAYELIVFPGHHEYVTRREYDLVRGFRNAGGNLLFLSANNFFWKVEVRRNVMRRVALWRRLGRPEAALIGVQYLANDEGGRQEPWVVRSTEAAPWLFAHTELAAGSAFGSGGIEIDALAPSSPRGVKVVAEIRNLYGRGYTAQMTYYRTPSGAEVVAAGAFSLARSLWFPDVTQLMENLFVHLAEEP
jgi:hypothetical protein